MRIKDLAAAAISRLTSGTSLVIDNGSVVEKIDYNLLAKAIVENYNGSSLAGSAQSVKSALDSLNSRFVLVSSGSLHDITKTGLYYLTSGVADKPVMQEGYGGLYIAGVAEGGTVAGTFVSLYDKTIWAIGKLPGDSWNYTSVNTKAQSTPMSGWTVYKNGIYATLHVTANIRENGYSEGETICTIAEGFRPRIQPDVQVFSTVGDFLGTIRIYGDGRVTPVFGTLQPGVSRFVVTYPLA